MTDFRIQMHNEDGVLVRREFFALYDTSELKGELDAMHYAYDSIEAKDKGHALTITDMEREVDIFGFCFQDPVEADLFIDGIFNYLHDFEDKKKPRPASGTTYRD